MLRNVRRLIPFIFITLVGCGTTEPDPVDISGPWTFEVVLDAPPEYQPCGWTLEAVFYGTTSGEGDVSWQCGDNSGQEHTYIVGIMTTEDAMSFFEGGCQYLLRLQTVDRFEGVVSCGEMAGEVTGVRGAP